MQSEAVEGHQRQPRDHLRLRLRHEAAQLTRDAGKCRLGACGKPRPHALVEQGAGEEDKIGLEERLLLEGDPEGCFAEPEQQVARGLRWRLVGRRQHGGAEPVDRGKGNLVQAGEVVEDVGLADADLAGERGGAEAFGPVASEQADGAFDDGGTGIAATRHACTY